MTSCISPHKSWRPPYRFRSGSDVSCPVDRTPGRIACRSLSQSQAGGNDQYVVVVSSDGVFLRQLRSHLGLVFIGPRQQENGLAPCLITVSLCFFAIREDGLQLRMNGTLTAAERTTASNGLSNPMKTISLSDKGIRLNAVRPKVKNSTVMTQSKPDPLMVTEVAAVHAFGVGSSTKPVRRSCACCR